MLSDRRPALYARHRRWLLTLATAHLGATIHLMGESQQSCCHRWRPATPIAHTGQGSPGPALRRHPASPAPPAPPRPPAATRGGLNIFTLSGGSPALLLFWMCVGNGALYTGALPVVQ